jgi:hypothetical protein
MPESTNKSWWTDLFSNPDTWAAIYGWYQNEQNKDRKPEFIMSPEDRERHNFMMGRARYSPERHFIQEGAMQQILGGNGFTPQGGFVSPYFQNQPWMGGYKAPTMDLSGVPAAWRRPLNPDGSPGPGTTPIGNGTPPPAAPVAPQARYGRGDGFKPMNRAALPDPSDMGGPGVQDQIRGFQNMPTPSAIPLGERGGTRVTFDPGKYGMDGAPVGRWYNSQGELVGGFDPNSGNRQPSPSPAGGPPGSPTTGGPGVSWWDNLIARVGTWFAANPEQGQNMLRNGFGTIGAAFGIPPQLTGPFGTRLAQYLASRGLIVNPGGLPQGPGVQQPSPLYQRPGGLPQGPGVINFPGPTNYHRP